MFKIIWNDGEKSQVTYPSVKSAIAWGTYCNEDFKVLDENDQVVEEYFAPRQGFVDVGGMSYDQVRRMNRE